MQLVPISTPLLKPGDQLADVLNQKSDLKDGDILVISSKAVATVEGAAIDLATVEVTPKAQELADTYGKSPAYYQVVLNETARMNGSIIQSVNGVVLTELVPDGLVEGTVLVPNAGIDKSNVEEGYVIGWPKDPVQSLKDLQKDLGKDIAIILTDSGLCPRRMGVAAFALACIGIDPFVSMIGTADLFGNEIRVTQEALADQLATAANTIMGNTNQSTPAVLVRSLAYEQSDFCGWVPGIQREKDIYHGVI